MTGMSPKQQYWITKCLAERVVPSALAEQAAAATDVKSASTALTELFKCPKAAAAVQYEQTEPAKPGYYVLDEVPHVVVVQKNGRSIAKRLVLPRYSGGRATWVYAKGVVFKLTGEPLTLVQAAEFGHLHGYCICCGLALDVPLSVAAGIGPKCVKKHFGITQLQFLNQKAAVA